MSSWSQVFKDFRYLWVVVGSIYFMLPVPFNLSTFLKKLYWDRFCSSIQPLLTPIHTAPQGPFSHLSMIKQTDADYTV